MSRLSPATCLSNLKSVALNWSDWSTVQTQTHIERPRQYLRYSLRSLGGDNPHISSVILATVFVTDSTTVHHCTTLSSREHHSCLTFSANVSAQTFQKCFSIKHFKKNILRVGHQVTRSAISVRVSHLMQHTTLLSLH